MDQELGSIMGFFYKVCPVKIYDLEVPENFEKPSLYFPEPATFDSNDTTSTYMVTNSLSVKFFHCDSRQAFEGATKIVNKIYSNRSVIPLLNKDGSDTGDYIRFTKIDVRKLENGVAAIVLTWDSRFKYKREFAPSIEDLHFETEVI